MVIEPCQQLNLFISYFLEFSKQAFDVIASFTPCNILGYAFQWEWFTKPLIHSW